MEVSSPLPTGVDSVTPAFQRRKLDLMAFVMCQQVGKLGLEPKMQEDILMPIFTAGGPIFPDER